MISNLRSSLDHLACQLALLNGNPVCVCEDTEFPIRVCDDDGAKKVFKKLSKYISPAALTKIEFFQPYRRQNPIVAVDEIRTDLHRLRELDNINKHRLPVVIDEWTVYKTVDIALNDRVHRIEMNNPMWERLKDQTESIFYVLLKTSDGSIAPLDAPPPKINVNPKYALDIAFNETGVCDNLRVFSVLSGIAKSVTSIVDDFAVLF